MEDIASLRTDIDKKLEKEMNNMTLLKDSLKKSSTNTNNMLSILSSFANRLKHLESTIVPVYKETEILRRRQENVEKTLYTVDNVLGYYHVARDVEAYIKEGPNASGLSAYLGYMDKLLKAMKYFESTDKRGKKLEEVSRLFEDGNDALQHEFRSLLSRHGRPVSPVDILDLLGTYEELPPIGTEANVHIQHLPEKVIEELAAISNWLITNGNNTDFNKPYMNFRSLILSKSIQGLKEHLRSASGNSTTLNLGVQNSPNVTSKVKIMNNTPIRKSRKKLTFLSKKATTALMSPFEPGHRRQGSSCDSIKEEYTDIETELYITELSALLRLMQSEAQLMTGIIPEKHHRMVFDTIVQSSLDTVVNEGEMLANSAEKNIGLHHEFTSVLSIFPIVKNLRTLKPDFDRILEGCQAPTRAKLASLLSTLDSTGAKVLEDTTNSIRMDPDKASNMPKDGTVHELANRTIIFLDQLKEYGETAGAMLLMHGEQATTSPNITPETCRMKVADYMTRVLAALGLNLTNKAETYGDPTLRPIFMLNNFNYILKSIKRSKLLDLLLIWNDKIGEYYTEQIQEQKRLYSQSWSKVLHYLLEVDKPISLQRAHDPSLAKIKDKDRQNIKDKFAGFNKELEEIYKIQKGYAIPDPELRRTLQEENKQFILPRYKMFLDKYTHLNFTKNPSKYIKYTLEEVALLIDKFFDAAA